MTRPDPRPGRGWKLGDADELEWLALFDTVPSVPLTDVLTRLRETFGCGES